MIAVYRSIRQRSEAKSEINKSLFIAYASPVETVAAADSFLSEIRQRHREANHHCSAYVLGRQGEQQKADDDGEPGGTAGRPILEVLSRCGVKNGMIVVVRYFGGILLGAGGLTRAYSQAAAAALTAAGIVEQRLHSRLSIEVDYAILATLENQLRLQRYPVEGKEYADTVRLAVLAANGREDSLRQLAADCSAGRAIIRENGERYLEIAPES
ncbi:MAG: YigZ family protein [Sporomusaceae bacterium]|nr:YigZ family protein [Sporomusaceae bacterium]